MSVELAGEQSVAEPSITVVQALPKSERADEAVELLTAVGVDRIVPWQAERAVARWSPERIERGLGRWQRTAAEAAKQSRRVRWPIISPPVGGRELLELLSAAPIALMCHEQAKVAIGSVPLDAADPEIVVVIGPEGGICAAELAAMTEAGAIAVSLGPTVLRTSVAGGLAAALVMSRVGRLASAGTLADYPVQCPVGRVGAPDGTGTP
jgi:16S rRNA (uracil1498-N3)-methyltransferase